MYSCPVHHPPDRYTAEHGYQKGRGSRVRTTSRHHKQGFLARGDRVLMGRRARLFLFLFFNFQNRTLHPMEHAVRAPLWMDVSSGRPCGDCQNFDYPAVSISISPPAFGLASFAYSYSWPSRVHRAADTAQPPGRQLGQGTAETRTTREGGWNRRRSVSYIRAVLAGMRLASFFGPRPGFGLSKVGNQKEAPT